MKKINFIYFGTPNISAQILQDLIDAKMPPTLVVCNPDNGPAVPPAKQVANQSSILVYQPEKLDMAEMKAKIAVAKFGVLFAYGKIIPQSIIDLFPKGILVIHPSLLPRLRGATPVPSIILTSEEKVGTTIFLMDEKVDHGPVIAQEELSENVSRATTQELFSKLIPLSSKLLIRTLPDFADNKITPTTQDETRATYTRKFSSDDGRVDLVKDSATTIDRKIRALNPEPGVWTILSKPLPREMCKITLPENKRIKLLEIKKEDDSFVIIKIQVEGKATQDITIHLP